MSSDRPSFRVESTDVMPQVTAAKLPGSANDSVANRPRNGRLSSYLTAKECDSVIARLSERDVAIVDAVAKLRYLSTKQLQRLHFGAGSNGSSNARRARLSLRRLSDLGVIRRLDRRVGGVRAGSSGIVVALDVVGQYLVRDRSDRRRRPPEPSPAFLDHTLAIAEVYVRLVEADRRGELELVEFQAEPRCWRDFFGSGGGRLTLKPDAFIRTASAEVEDLWFLEVDRSTHAVPALGSKFRAYRQYWATGAEQRRWDDTFPKVLWLAQDTVRVRKLVDVTTRQPTEARELFVVRLFDEALSALTPEPAA